MKRDTRSLATALQARYADDESISVRLVEGADPAINVTMHDYGDMDIQIVASEDQILVSTNLVDASQVSDTAGLNEAALLLNPINPLSNIGLVAHDGRKTYVVFGELSSLSSLDAVDEEIRILAENTIDAAQSLKSFFV